MLIRSQDKTKLIPFEGSNGVYIIGNEVHIDGDNYGEYSTKEKAIKVLDMIQKKYLEYEKMDGRVLNQYSAISPFAFIPPKVFQMPQDSEV